MSAELLEKLAEARAIVAKALGQIIRGGLPVKIDRPKGTVQNGTAEDGSTWTRTYKVDYGFFDGTQGGDGEGLDCYVGDDEQSPDAYWIHQLDGEGGFDEFKVMLGFSNEADAKAMYLDHTPEKYFGSMTSVPVVAMRALLGIDPSPSASDTEKAVAKAMTELAFGWGLRIADAAAHVPSGAQDVPVTKFTKPRAITSIVSKADAAAPAEERTVLGVVLVPDDVDSQGDTYNAEEVRKTAHLYMEEYRNVGLQHKMLINPKVKLVESYLAPVDMNIAGSAITAGTWMMKVHVLDDDIWNAVKSGALTGFSISGLATKTPVSDAA